VPFLLAHFFPSGGATECPLRTAVHHLPIRRFRIDPPVLKEFPAMQIRMILAQLDQAAHELKQARGYRPGPVVPARLVVLSVCVIVSMLRAPISSPPQIMGPLRKQQGRKKIPFLSLPELQNFPDHWQAFHPQFHE